MKILVYGAGVLGCNLARNLLRAGKDVTLLARGNWAAEIKQNGLRVKDKFSPRTSVSRIPVVTKLCAADHAMNAIDEMSAMNRDLKIFFDEKDAPYPVWQALEAEAGRYLQ